MRYLTRLPVSTRPAQQWIDVTVEDLPALSRGILKGKKSAEEGTRIVVPCSLAENLSIEWLNTVFANQDPTPMEIWVGIVADDSSLVYYKLSKGIVKPPM
ncbi:hypothetical protein DL93DRAFT_2162719 [Clavulina sp. PMI_390]|nr:hypothetical protein DL93DRAFT_2162719 [Clavulina sp. PMI_390]